MAANIPLTLEPPPRYHTRQALGSDSLYLGKVTSLYASIRLDTFLFVLPTAQLALVLSKGSST
jgi:hypothetical protein